MHNNLAVFKILPSIKLKIVSLLKNYIAQQSGLDLRTFFNQYLRTLRYQH